MIGECVCYDDGNYDIPSVFSREIVVARKDHECCECHEPIRRGTRYERIRGLWRGQWSGANTCLTCATIRRDLYPCGGPPLGELAYALGEDYGITLVGPVDDAEAVGGGEE